MLNQKCSFAYQKQIQFGYRYWNDSKKNKIFIPLIVNVPLGVVTSEYNLTSCNAFNIYNFEKSIHEKTKHKTICVNLCGHNYTTEVDQPVKNSLCFEAIS